MYERLLRPLLFALDPETAHHFALAFLRATGPLLPKTIDTISPVSAFGLNFRHRIGLAAGLDKNGVALSACPQRQCFSYIAINGQDDHSPHRQAAVLQLQKYVPPFTKSDPPRRG